MLAFRFAENFPTFVRLSMNQFVQTPDAPIASNSNSALAESHVERAESLSETAGFVDRRKGGDSDQPGRERRQFTNSHQELSKEASDLATAIDEYKLRHRRRFITYEEMLSVIKSLGYKLS
jgi:hypothetical protein